MDQIKENPSNLKTHKILEPLKSLRCDCQEPNVSNIPKHEDKDAILAIKRSIKI